MTLKTLALRGVLHAAGIPGAVVEIPDQYWNDSPVYDSVRNPWLRVFTSRGVIVIGHRKRVISLDWSDGTFSATGAEVVANPDFTHDRSMCHAWSYDEAIGCLKRLWSHQPSEARVV